MADEKPAEREGIEYTGNHNPADFAPPDQSTEDGSGQGFLASQPKAKVVEPPDEDDKPTGKTRARTK
jgi:hypothetical protein